MYFVQVSCGPSPSAVTACMYPRPTADRVNSKQSSHGRTVKSPSRLSSTVLASCPSPGPPLLMTVMSVMTMQCRWQPWHWQTADGKAPPTRPPRSFYFRIV